MIGLNPIQTPQNYLLCPFGFASKMQNMTFGGFYLIAGIIYAFLK